MRFGTVQTGSRNSTCCLSPAFFSYGFRPLFLGAALFAGVAAPAWILLLTGTGNLDFYSAARPWHIHEMVFGFLPAVITGFLLTAIPNWTDRAPIRGPELMLLCALWLAGRLVMAIPLLTPLLSACVDAAFLIAVAGRLKNGNSLRVTHSRNLRLSMAQAFRKTRNDE